MAVPVVVPKLGMSMGEARVAEWYQADGATVSLGEPVFCIETDHIAFDVEAEGDGVLRHRTTAGGSCPAGEVIGLILAPGERVPASDLEPAFEEPAETTAMTDPERDEPIIHEPEPEKVDAALFERVLLFPRRLLKPARAEPGPSGVARLTDEAPGKGWEAVPDDGQDFAAAWAATKERRARETEGAGDAAPAVEARVEHATSSSEPKSAWIKPEPDEVPFVAEAGPVAAPSVAPVATPAPAMAARGTPAIRLVVGVEEATKMAQQLTREWTASGVAPSIEDIVVRAVARALPGGQRATDSDGVALWVLRDEKDTRHVLREAGRRPFKEAVETLARLVHANLGDDACRASVTSLAAFGVDEGTVEPGNGESLAVCLGATRSVPAVEGDHVTERQVTTLTIGWDPDRVSMAAAARFSARVRELIEAPYVLLAD